MADLNKGFHIQTNGNWPLETYSAFPSAAFINPSLGFLPALNNYRFLYNTINETNQLNNYSYNNANYLFREETGYYCIDTRPNANIYWNLSTTRILNNLPPQFNYFSVSPNPGADVNYRKYYAYLLYPSRLFLKPISLTKQSGYWELTTSTVVAPATSFYFYSETPEADAERTHLNYLKNSTVNFLNLPNSSSYFIQHTLSATRGYLDKPIFYFTENYNPVYYSEVLEIDTLNPDLSINGAIRLDSPLLTYDVKYYKTDYIPKEDDFEEDHVINLKQHLSELGEEFTQNFTSTYILNYDNLYKNELIFQMVQFKPDGGLLELSDSTYCILSSNLDLLNFDFQYFSKFSYGDNFSIVNSLTGIADSYVGISYIIDSEKFAFTPETWQSTLLDFKINNSSSPLGVLNSCDNLQNNTATWKTKYPPHYYAYKASVYNPSLTSTALETVNLNFYLRSSAQYLSTTSCILSSYITTDYNLLTYNLVEHAETEYIKYEVVDNPLMILYKNVKGYYGTNYDQLYDLENSPWVPTVSGSSILIDYPDAPFGQYFFTIKATLCSKAGLLPSREVTRIKFAENMMIFSSGNPMYFKTFKNVPNSLEVSVAHLTAFPAFPAKDLRNSYISWNISPSSIKAKIQALDLSGNYIKDITPLEPLLFSDETSRVRVTDFGFTALQLTVSSQKYSEIAQISATAFTNPFIENKFAIGFSEPFSNEFVTRKASITGALPFLGETFAIPLSTPVSWMWKYNFNFDPNSQPIKAYVGPDRVPYEFGDEGLSQDLSALYLEITPVESDVIPPLNSVKVFLVTRNRDPFVVGSYEFFVDDFPSRRLLNTDMLVYYCREDGSFFEDLEGSRILDTRENNFVITRPNDGTNMFIISAHEMFGGLEEDSTFIWSISDNVSGEYLPIATTYQRIQTEPLALKIDSLATETIVTLSALSAWPFQWRSLNILRNIDYPISPLHSIYTAITINTPNSAEFYKPLEIINFPEFTWIDSQKLTILNKNNYTLADSTTAFLNKKSNTVRFYLSANKDIFNQYDYYISSQVNFLSSLSSYFGYMDIPYSAEFESVTGLQISLTAFGQDYPSNYPVYFTKPESTSLNSPLCTYYFAITSQTVPRFTESVSEFKKNPRTLAYNTSANFNFSIPNTSISLNNTRQLSIVQYLSTIPPNSPVRAQLSNGTITYAISSEFWQKTVNIPTLNGLFKAFNLNVGDPYEVGYLSNTKLNYLKFKPLYTEFNAAIPPETFSEYTDEDYPGERDLWNSIPVKQELLNTDWITIQAYATGIDVEAYVSDFIAVTGQEIAVEFLPVNETDSLKISFYRTNFGENNNFVLSQKGELAKYSYSTTGSFYISYEIQYNDGSVSFHQYPTPIKIKQRWEPYNQEAIRTLDELTLQMPFSLEQIEIQPNEWGDVDIFNTAITRLYENLKYLQSNTQTINTDFPTLIYGWFGCDKNQKGSGIRWYVKNFDKDINRDLHLDATAAVDKDARSFFSNISSIAATDNYLYVMQSGISYTDLNIRVFDLKDGYDGREIIFFNQADLQEEFILPIKIEVINDKFLYVLDKARSKVVKLDLDFTENIFNVSNSVGSFGSREEGSKLSSPSDMQILEESVYVLDSGNRCIKEYTPDLNWVNTYYHTDFATDAPIKISAQHPGMVYVLTSTFKVYVLEQNSSEALDIFPLEQIYSEFDILNKLEAPTVVNLTFDEEGEFLYVAVVQNTPTVKYNRIFKYSAVGLYVGSYDLYTPDTFVMSDFVKSKNRYLMVSSNKAIVKMQDVVEFFKIGDGLPYQEWALDQILLDHSNFASDLMYNKSLNRLIQNIKMFRDNLNGKFVKVSEQTPTGVVTYFTITPTAVEDQPIFEIDIEASNTLVGTNELHIPQVLNREFRKIYEALMSLKRFLDIDELSLPALKVESIGVSVLCENEFCWSWKATAGYNLKFPAIRICNINPITYQELKESFPVSYAPTKTWAEATSDCCTKPEHLK